MAYCIHADSIKTFSTESEGPVVCKFFISNLTLANIAIEDSLDPMPRSIEVSKGYLYLTYQKSVDVVSLLRGTHKTVQFSRDINAVCIKGHTICASYCKKNSVCVKNHKTNSTLLFFPNVRKHECCF